ncbi:hypothetical protein ACIBEF_25125 [Micromonospora sp. NPDC050795]|uniref:hypothetical protein n=1 Tax=Micromonospora sp. NPDC050795 TaxID=3364282 RepID=UPI0037BDB9D8
MSRTSVHEAAVLRQGGHCHPRQGACLVEIAATLSGGRWTDHPTTIDPALAAVARAVNDRSSDAGRPDLLALAPWLPRPAATTSSAATARIVTVVGRRGLAVADAGTAARLAPDLATIATADSTASGWAAYQRRRRAARVIRLAVRAVARTGDPALWSLLREAITIARAADGLAALPERGDLARLGGWPERLPIHVQIRVPDGGESTYYHCTPVLDRWPATLVRDWAVRRAELDLITAEGGGRVTR